MIMMLHTVMPHDFVFPQEVEPGDYTQVEGGYAEVCKNADGKKSLRRLISTDPKLFLKADFSPGSFID